MQRKIPSHILISTMLMTIAVQSYAQKTWTLEECLEYATVNNIQIKKSSIAVERKETEVLESDLEIIPNLNLSADRNYSWGRSVDMQELIVIKNKMNSSLSLAASAAIPVINGFSNLFDSKISRVELEISEQERLKTNLDIRIQVIKAYLEMLLAKEIHIIAVRNYEEIATQVSKCQELIETGRQSHSSLATLESKLAESKVQMIDALWQIESCRLALEQILDMSYGTISDISDYDIQAITFSSTLPLAKESTVNARNSPDVEIARLNRDLAVLNHKRVRASMIPVIGVSLGYMTYFSSTSSDKARDQLSSNVNPTIGISLQIPMFETFKTATKLKRSKLDISYAALEMRDRENKYYSEINDVIIQASKYYNSTKALKESVLSAEESLSDVQAKFESGIATALDLLAAQNAHITAQSQLYRSAVQYVFELKLIECIKGDGISL